MSTDLTEALATLAATGTRRPYDARVESACNAATRAVIDAYGLELGSRSEAIRELLSLGAAVLAATRA